MTATRPISAARHLPGEKEANRIPLVLDAAANQKAEKKPKPGMDFRIRALVLRTAALWPLKKASIQGFDVREGLRSQVDLLHLSGKARSGVRGKLRDLLIKDSRRV